MPPRPRTTAARPRVPSDEEAALLTVYQDAERYLLETVAGSVDTVAATADAGRDPATAQADGARQVRGAVEATVLGLDRGAKARTEAIIGGAAQGGADEAVRQLGEISGGGVDPGRGDTINRGAIDRLAVSTLDLITPAHASILRTVPDAYRDVIARTVSGVLVGAQTRREASQRAMWALTDRGLTSFTDRGGRRWRLSSYVEMATRTAAARAHTDALLDRLAAAGRDLVIVGDAANECERCRPWEGKILARTGPTGQVQAVHALTDAPITVDVAGTVDEARRAGLFHPNCFPGDTLVSAPSGVRASDARWYEGDLVVIHTAGGDELSVTPNHPVLTPEGWVAAGALAVGKHVLRHDREIERVGAVGPRDVQVQARIGEIHNALREAGQVTAVRVPATAEQFHGDTGQSDVEVVFADGLLQDGGLTSGGEQRGERALVVGGVRFADLLGGGPFHEIVTAAGHAAHGVVRGSDLPAALLCAHGRPLPSLGRAAVRAVTARQQRLADAGLHPPESLADLALTEAVEVQPDGLVEPVVSALLGHPRGAQAPVDDVTADSDGGRDLARSLAASVAADHVVKIERRHFAGHVYNLETGSGWYLASRIVVHNCRHDLALYTPGVTAPLVVTRDPDGFAATQRQRGIERHLRDWKEREAAALTPDAKRQAKARGKQWGAAMRDHLAAHPDLRRKREREGIDAGNAPTAALRARLGDGGPIAPAVKGAARRPRDMVDAELDPIRP